MHKRRHIVITGTQSFSKDKDEPLGTRFCLPMFVLKTLTFITDETLAISQGQTQGIDVFKTCVVSVQVSDDNFGNYNFF